MSWYSYIIKKIWFLFLLWIITINFYWTNFNVSNELPWIKVLPINMELIMFHWFLLQYLNIYKCKKWLLKKTTRLPLLLHIFDLSFVSFSMTLSVCFYMFQCILIYPDVSKLWVYPCVFICFNVSVYFQSFHCLHL